MQRSAGGSYFSRCDFPATPASVHASFDETAPTLIISRRRVAL
jgi:hypothetical protein